LLFDDPAPVDPEAGFATQVVVPVAVERVYPELQAKQCKDVKLEQVITHPVKAASVEVGQA